MNGNEKSEFSNMLEVMSIQVMSSFVCTKPSLTKSDFLLAHEVSHFKYVEDKMWHQPARVEKSWPPFCKIWIIFTHLRHDFKWVKIQIE